MKEASKLFYGTLAFIQLLVLAAWYLNFNPHWSWLDLHIDHWKFWLPMIAFVVFKVGFMLAFAVEGLASIIVKLALAGFVVWLFFYLFVL